MAFDAGTNFVNMKKRSSQTSGELIFYCLNYPILKIWRYKAQRPKPCSKPYIHPQSGRRLYMINLQDIHKNLMEKINEAVQDAMEKLDQVNDTELPYGLSVVVDTIIEGPTSVDPTGYYPLSNGLSIIGLRENLLRVSTECAQLAGSMPTEKPGPNGRVDLDLLNASFIFEAESPNQGFSVN